MIITLPDRTKVKYDKKDITPLEIAKDIDITMPKKVICAEVNGEFVDANYPITQDSEVKLIFYGDKEGKDVFRHSSSHVLAAAVKKLFSDVKFGIGPAVEEGFYYDFEKKEPFTPEDLVKIEKEMKNIVRQDIKFERKEVTKANAKKLFKDQPYKLELLEEVDNPIIYKIGDFTDLCKGPHVVSTDRIRSFKLLKIAGAYWKGDAKNSQLQRIYGISFPEKEQLQDYLKIREEAEKRDHRKIGKELELFSIHDEAPGMPFFHDKGNYIWEKLKDFMTSEMRKLDYEINKTPIILNKKLWLQSGHWDHYKENMYFTNIDEGEYAVKPMNCPGNILIYKNRQHSYRELPIKAGEFGLVHRHELSGVLSGLFRVRVFTQDDAHVFCTKEQLQEQIIELIDLIDRVYSIFGFKYNVELSTKPEKAMGDPKIWEIAEKALADAMKVKKMKFKVNPGDGAFYGPKLDFHVKDAIGRSWQCGTIQLDFSMPEKFDMTYEGQDGKKHRPIMLHRAIYGSLERFIGILIEHFAGWFPLWMNPHHARVMAVSDAYNKYAQKVVDELKKAGLRVDFDDRAESIGKKVRDAQHLKIPIIINVGEKEEKANTVAVRTADNKLHFGVKVKDLIKKINDNIEKKEIEFKL